MTTFDPVPWAGIIDIVAAGFPCQPVSCAGMRLGTKDPRWLWPWIAEIIRILGPRFVFLENVPGLLTAGIGDVLGDLAEMGFRIEYGVFSCGSLGASHLRNRVAILAYSESLQCGQGGQAQAKRPGGPLRIGEGLANPDGELRQQSVPIPGGDGQAEPGATGPDVGHSDSLRGRGDGFPLPGDTQAQRAIQRVANTDKFPGWGTLWDRRHETSGGSEVLADSNGSGLPLGQEQYHPQRSTTERGGRALWAPGPDADWTAIPRHLWPSEQPVCGVASGFPRGLEPDRRDRLRALGNAYSPPVAAVAWRVLKDRLMNL